MFRFENVIIRVWSHDHNPPHVEAYWPSMKRPEAHAKFSWIRLSALSVMDFQSKILRAFKQNLKSDTKNSGKDGDKYMDKKIKYGKKDLLSPETFNPKTAKERVTIWLDEEVLDVFRHKAKDEGTKYQTLINQALRQVATKPSLVERIEQLEKKVGTGNK